MLCIFLPFQKAVPPSISKLKLLYLLFVFDWASATKLPSISVIFILQLSVNPEILIFLFCISKPGLIGFGYMNVSEKVSFVEELPVP